MQPDDELAEMEAKIMAAARNGELQVPEGCDPYELADIGIRDLIDRQRRGVI